MTDTEPDAAAAALQELIHDFYGGDPDNMWDHDRGLGIFEDWQWRQGTPERIATLEAFCPNYSEPDPDREPLEITGWNVRYAEGQPFDELDPRILPADEEEHLAKAALVRTGRICTRMSGYQARGFLNGLYSVMGPHPDSDGNELCNSVMDILEEVRALRAEVAELRECTG
jgi:hypothetical protein